MKKLVRDSRTLFRAAVRSVQADRLLEGFDFEGVVGRPLTQFQNTWVVGAGKAAMALAGALEGAFPGRITGGSVAVPSGYAVALPARQRRPSLISVVEAGHPVPDEGSVTAADHALNAARRCGVQDLLIVLLSGGGSALWCAPAEGVSLPDLKQIGRALLRSGADIHEFNAVRRKLSRIKGGRLHQAARPSATLTLAISDVPSDDPSVIASGPMTPDKTTLADARGVLRRYRLWESAPASVRRALRDGAGGPSVRVPSAMERVQLIGSSRHALRSAAQKARPRGYAPALRFDVTGEARSVGQKLAAEILAAPPKTCLLWGGETTVNVTGRGIGGRNHEVALAAAMELAGSDRHAVVLSAGTDGIDGMTPAAGAWATPHTVAMARAQGADARSALLNNDSYRFFAAAGGSLHTGPTHTNVMDVMIALAA